MVAYLLATIIKNASSTMELALFFYGMTVGLIIAYLLIYKNFKISLHMLGIGGLLGFLMFVSYHYELNLLILISSFFIISGLIAISRIKLKAHTLKEIYLGFLVGMVSEIIVYILYII
jgi:membrane-associated phospholipid phosphatase